MNSLPVWASRVDSHERLPSHRQVCVPAGANAFDLVTWRVGLRLRAEVIYDVPVVAVSKRHPVNCLRSDIWHVREGSANQIPQLVIFCCGYPQMLSLVPVTRRWCQDASLAEAPQEDATGSKKPKRFQHHWPMEAGQQAFVSQFCKRSGAEQSSLCERGLFSPAGQVCVRPKGLKTSWLDMKG